MLCVLDKYLGCFPKNPSKPEKNDRIFFIVFSNIERVTVSQSRRLIIGRRPINEDIDKRISICLCTYNKKT